MEHLSFILWLCLFPLTIAIISYLDTKEEALKPKNPDSRTKIQIKKDEKDTNNGITILLLFYIFIAIILF